MIELTSIEDIKNNSQITYIEKDNLIQVEFKKDVKIHIPFGELFSENLGYKEKIKVVIKGKNLEFVEGFFTNDIIANNISVIDYLFFGKIEAKGILSGDDFKGKEIICNKINCKILNCYKISCKEVISEYLTDGKIVLINCQAREMFNYGSK